MPTYDWPLIQQRSGDSIESLVATLLRREFADARQINPSQGDGGIDIIRCTPSGDEVWQVKGFTTVMTSSQFRQVRRSWDRFVEQHVSPGERRIVRYHLVTPWTPTEERVAEFKDLTAQASFPCQWDSDAFLAGLADRHAETMQRFIYGNGVLEQFVSQKAMLAASPVERGESLTMLHAIEARQDALDALRNMISDNYFIEHGIRTVPNAGEVPLPAYDDPAVFHRMTYLGDSRWKYESLVPRSLDAVDIEPIQLNLEFLATPSTREYEAIQAWYEWGIPFQNARVRTMTIGGPFADEDPVESTVSIIDRGHVEVPSLYLRCTTSDGQTRFRLPMTAVSRTIGAQTGWIRLLGDTPERTLSIELRFKQGEGAEGKIQMGNVDGRNPEAVRDELATLLCVSASDVISVETGSAQTLIRARETVLPTALEAILFPVARHLTTLQTYTASMLVMPSVTEITDRQYRYLALLDSIYSGTPHNWTWTELSLRVPDEFDGSTRATLADMDPAAGGPSLVKVEAPMFQLGNRTYAMDHPLASTAHSVRLEPGVNPADLSSGHTFRLIPGSDAQVTTAKVVNWTPGSIEFG